MGIGDELAAARLESTPRLGVRESGWPRKEMIRSDGGRGESRRFTLLAVRRVVGRKDSTGSFGRGEPMEESMGRF